MKAVLNALLNQLNSFSDLSYAHKYGYISRDPFELVEKNNFPFYNVFPGVKRVAATDNLSIKEFERHVYPVTIHFATASMLINVAIMGDDKVGTIGILDLADDIWAAIILDRTLGGIVDGILPGYEAPWDMLKGESDNFVAIGEIVVEFFKDKAIA